MADYCTRTNVTDFLKDSAQVTSGDYNTIIDTLITRVSKFIDSETQRPHGFGVTASLAKTFDGDGGTRLHVPDLVTLTQVRVKLDGTSGTTWTTGTIGEFFLRPKSWTAQGWPALWVDISDQASGSVTYFPKGYDTVELTGTWGWAAVPKDIEQVCVNLTVRLFRARGTGMSDQVGVSLDPTDQITISKLVTPTDWRVLNHYRGSYFV